MKTPLLVITLLAGAASLGGFAYATARGASFGAPTQRFVPEQVRASPNGYRSFHFWHAGYGGYRGGK